MEKPIPGIGLFGGTFDPVHNGHIAIATSFLNSKYTSELWILLTPHPPHKGDHSLSDYNIRLTMLQQAFGPMEQVVISNIENQLPDPSYTVRTLRYFHKKYIQQPFYLCLGEDSVKNFDKWQNWQEILCYCDLLAARRPSVDEVLLDEKIARQTHFVTHKAVEISSTTIRKLVSDGKSIAHLVPPEVEKIIRENNLYMK